MPGSYHGVHQIILTSINHQNSWTSDESGMEYGPNAPAYIAGNVQSSKLTWGLVEIERPGPI